MRINISSNAGVTKTSALDSKKQEIKKPSKKKSKINVVEEIPEVNLAIEEEIDNILNLDKDLEILNEEK